MGGHRDQAGGLTNHGVLHVPLAVPIRGGHPQRPRDDVHVLRSLTQLPHKALKACPVVPVEALADLRADVDEAECLVHLLLAALVVGGRGHVAPVVARVAVIRELGTELSVYPIILVKHGVTPVRLPTQLLLVEVLQNPLGVARAVVIPSNITLVDAVCVRLWHAELKGIMRRGVIGRPCRCTSYSLWLLYLGKVDVAATRSHAHPYCEAYH
mmetsp:Transcript_21326/g.46601  ORF Transcript_21326/g.46601 Transcript_21326/m.46601 type:complete len:212 (-) Transcript_21326:91-726(-)